MKLFSLFFLLICIFTNTFAADSGYEFSLSPDEFDYDDSDDKPWVEDQLAALSPPDFEAIKELRIDHPPVGFKVFIDPDSLSVSENDAVVRYWLVLKSGKSRNTFYEGLKCTSREYKTYAFVNKWDPSKVKIDKNAQWRAIETQSHNKFREELRQFFFCNQVLPRSKAEILQRVNGYVTFSSDEAERPF